MKRLFAATLLVLTLIALVDCEADEGEGWTIQTESWVDTECEFQPPCDGAAWVQRPQWLHRPDIDDTITAFCFWDCPAPDGFPACPGKCTNPERPIPYVMKNYERSTTVCEPWYQRGKDLLNGLALCNEKNPVYGY